MNNLLAVPESSRDVSGDYDRLIASLHDLSPLEAINRLKQFLQTYPSFAQGHNDLGVLYLKAGNPTLALAHHEKACRLQPETITFRKNLADFYAVELGWLDDAVDIYLEILKRNPRDTEALIALGRLGSALEGTMSLAAPAEHAELPAPAKASPVPAQQPAYVAAPPPPQKTFEERYHEARELAAASRFAEARPILEELAGAIPGRAVVHNDLGVVCYNLGDLDAAQTAYENAHGLDPANAVFARNLADLCFTHLGRGDDAIRIYLDLHRRNPRDVETLVNLGHICAAVGRPEEARTFYRRVLEIEPWNSEARQALASVQQAASSVQPRRTAEDLHGEASRHAAAARYQEASSLLEELIRLYPDYALGYNDLGVVRYQLGNSTGACTAYERAVELQPKNANFRKNLADLYVAEMGRTDDAIRIYLELFREQPRDMEILLALGQICSAVGRPEEAKTFFRRALEIEPWNGEVRQALRLLA